MNFRHRKYQSIRNLIYQHYGHMPANISYNYCLYLLFSIISMTSLTLPDAKSNIARFIEILTIRQTKSSTIPPHKILTRVSIVIIRMKHALSQSLSPLDQEW